MLVGAHGQFLRGLQTAFHRSAMSRSYSPLFLNQQRVCFLAAFDLEQRPCEGRWEAFHFIGRQRLRNVLWGFLHGAEYEEVEGMPMLVMSYQVDPLIELAEWDPRNAGPGCVHHHRRYDSHATPELIVPYASVPDDTIEFIEDWGLESAAEQRFDGPPPEKLELPW